MNELPTVQLVVALIGEDRSVLQGKRPYVLFHEDGRAYRGVRNEEDSSVERGEVFCFYTRGDDEPYGSTLRGFDSMQFLGNAQGTELEPLWKSTFRRAS